MNALHCLHWQVPMKRKRATDNEKGRELLIECRNVICVTCDHTRGENTLAHEHTHTYKRRIIVEIDKIVVFNKQLNMYPPCFTEVSSTYRLCIINRNNENWTSNTCMFYIVPFLIARETTSEKNWLLPRYEPTSQDTTNTQKTRNIKQTGSERERERERVYIRAFCIDHLLMCRIHKHAQNLIISLKSR